MKFFKALMVICLTMSFGLAAVADEPAATVSESSGDKIPVPTGKYITGGVLASTVGFGIGHAIEGRWYDKGWIFTATETAGLAAVIVGLANCNTSTDSNGYNHSDCPNGGAAVIGLGVLIGFHVWEIIDAWTGARPVDDNSPKVYIRPDDKAPGFGVAWSF